MELPVLVFVVLVALVVVQGALAVGFSAVLNRAGRQPSSPYEPKAALVLCLRGVDPFLSACLDGVLRQDYPDYDVRIVVDSTSDPAWSIAERAIAASANRRARLLPLSDRRATCSLKCSSILQAIGTLEPSHEVLALVDADTVPHPTWLRELVAPLADPHVGAATGNRWYMPREKSWGALVRYYWNLAAIVQMYFFHIAWGGSLAVKTSLFRQSDLLERWGHAFCEDTMMYRVLRRQGMRLAFVPSLMMVNREGCDMKGFSSWVTRQLLTARLYHPGWLLTVGHGFATSAALLAVSGLLFYSAVERQWGAVAWSAGGLALYQAAMLVMAAFMEAAVRRVVRQRGEPVGWLNPLAVLQCAVAMPLTQIVYSRALIKAIFLRRVSWRGVKYHVGGPRAIAVVEDRPYCEAPLPSGELASI